MTAGRSASGQRISAPTLTAFSGFTRDRFPASSSAQRIMPSETIPASFAGFRFVITRTFFPTISSGLYHCLIPDRIWALLHLLAGDNLAHLDLKLIELLNRNLCLRLDIHSV